MLFTLTGSRWFMVKGLQRVSTSGTLRLGTNLSWFYFIFIFLHFVTCKYFDTDKHDIFSRSEITLIRYEKCSLIGLCYTDA